MVLNYLQDLPEDESTVEDTEATCKLCHQAFTAQRYLFTHLSDFHFATQLDSELPKSGPWKCPKCSYIGSDPRALRVHYGVRHKIVLNHLAATLGVNCAVLKKELSAGRKRVLRNNFSCRHCHQQFRDQRELDRHTLLHFRQQLVRQLPMRAPFSCPKCDLVASDQMSLVFHYGFDHPEVLATMHDVDGDDDDEDDEDNDDDDDDDDDDESDDFTTVTAQLLSQQRHLDDDKKFPKCRICNYRYFTRLDLCRHFVDFHLRRRIAGKTDYSLSFWS